MHLQMTVTDSSSHFLSGEDEDLPQYLVPPRIERSDGMGPVVDLGLHRPNLLVITLGINHVLEHEWLRVSVWGSADASDWGLKPLASLPPKCYCGINSMFLDLAKNPEIRYLRVQWNMLRWGRSDHTPLFGFYVAAEESNVSRR